ncbi:HDOD domain-containing protein [Methylomonas methanica]|uniref:Putative signal transduction protein n=1 Tax=Methylomonas methanica (strain DSM 25384 / MC09) TaxID=857087 RepID=G0A012_METMM|nr:HDOD domain-containing protein [Methylomonas methanica]AEG01151.1 putative signal transduction protein [Methylomonas methanica MC09]
MPKNQIITNETTQKLLKGITIPPQPQIMVDLQMEMAMPEPSFATMTKIITKDVGISGSILKVINSPFFQLRNQVTSIGQALNLLGFKNVVNIVNSLSIRSSLSDNAITGLTQFWDNAQDVAMAAAAISKLTGVASPDEAYTLGLFHNSGIPLLMQKFEQYPSVLKRAYAETDKLITDIENEMIASNHSVVGYYVAKAWKLPSYIAQAIADHHKVAPIFADKIACDPSEKNLLALLKLAETTCKTYKMLGNAAVDHEFYRIKTDLLIYIGLSEYDFEDLQAEVIEMGLH